MHPGHFYHVYNRGNNRQAVFKDDRDCFSFLYRWKKYIHPVAETFAYTLLPNHFHAVIRIREEAEPTAIDRAFANFFIAYARTFQRRHAHHGALFHRPYKRREILDDDALRWTIGYVLTNCTHHDAAKDYRLHPHSSYSTCLSDAPTLLERDRVLALFDGREGLLAHLENQAACYRLDADWEEA